MKRIERVLFAALALSLTALAAEPAKTNSTSPQQTPGIYYCALYGGTGAADAIALKKALTPPNAMRDIYNTERNTLLTTLRALGISESDLDSSKRRKFVMRKIDESAARISQIDERLSALRKNNINVLEGREYKKLLKEKKGLLSLQRWMESEKVGGRNQGLRQSLQNWIRGQQVDPSGSKPSYPIRTPAEQAATYTKLRASQRWNKALEAESKVAFKKNVENHVAHFGNTLAPAELRKDLKEKGVVKLWNWSPKARGQYLGRGLFWGANIFAAADIAGRIWGTCSTKVEDLSNVGQPVAVVKTKAVPAKPNGPAQVEHKIVDVTPIAPKVVEQVPAETHAAAPVATTGHTPEAAAPAHAATTSATPAPASEAPATPLVRPPTKVDTAAESASDTFFNRVDPNRDTSTLY